MCHGAWIFRIGCEIRFEFGDYSFATSRNGLLLKHGNSPVDPEVAHRKSFMFCPWTSPVVLALLVVWAFGERTLRSAGNRPVARQEPYFSEPVKNATVAAGREVTLSCSVENIGHFKVAWMHTNRHLLVSLHDQMITREARFTVTNNNYQTWWLHIGDVRLEDAGEYMCQINTSPMKSSSGYLDVVVPPLIVEDMTSSDTLVREGNPVTLRCQAEGYPEPKITWRREDGSGILIAKKTVPSINGEWLNLTKSSRGHTGAYLCIATNGVQPSVSKRILLSVLFPPMLWIPSQLVGAPLESDVLLSCHLEAFPPATLHWLKDKEPLPHTKDKYHLNHTEKGPYKAQVTLRIHRTQVEDFGSYTCIARNELGKTEGTIRLYGIQQPKSDDVVMGAWHNNNNVAASSSSAANGAKRAKDGKTGSDFADLIHSSATLPSVKRNADSESKGGAACLDCRYHIHLFSLTASLLLRLTT